MLRKFSKISSLLGHWTCSLVVSLAFSGWAIPQPMALNLPRAHQNTHFTSLHLFSVDTGSHFVHFGLKLAVKQRMILNFLVLLPPSKCWGYRCVPLHLGAEGQTQGFMHARQSVLPTELCFQMNTDSLFLTKFLDVVMAKFARVN